MLETTHFVGGKPDVTLVYRLRRLALDGNKVLTIFNVIAKHLQIPENDIGSIELLSYFRLAFGGSTTNFTNLIFLVNRLERNRDGYSTTREDLANELSASIEANRENWSMHLGPDETSSI